MTKTDKDRRKFSTRARLHRKKLHIQSSFRRFITRFKLHFVPLEYIVDTTAHISGISRGQIIRSIKKWLHDGFSVRGAVFFVSSSFLGPGKFAAMVKKAPSSLKNNKKEEKEFFEKMMTTFQFHDNTYVIKDVIEQVRAFVKSPRARELYEQTLAKFRESERKNDSYLATNAVLKAAFTEAIGVYYQLDARAPGTLELITDELIEKNIDHILSLP